ncbi:hypothetical protein I7X43_14625 [Inhella sp. 4Y17]|uniref:Uncharacterized protein n=2 Tax=Inhella gelatinilytica TaxID=2795030 RepID=A0A931IWG1_9BURK|nr:hypothetical protein [Inhella gelatinilytica]MBH9554077.1 hypothetical protein [Inhella gelatinilytica]
MRAVFSVLGLVLVAAMVLSLAKKQMQTTVTLPSDAASAAAGASAVPLQALPAAVEQQVQGQLQQAADRASAAATP